MADDDDNPKGTSTNTVGEVTGGSVGNVQGDVNITNNYPPAPTPADPLALHPPPDAPIEPHPTPAPPAPDPDTPYPLLHPIKHPDALGGRDTELTTLRILIDHSDGLLALYAPSGQGKSSLIMAGLVPTLRADDIPTTLHRHPATPQLGRALIEGLVAQPAVPELPDDDPRPFAAWIDAIARATGERPVVVLDQFEAIFKADDEGRAETPRPSRAADPATEPTSPTAPDDPADQTRPLTARARVGLLLAATVNPGSGRPKCRWVLAYREEFHGQVQRWLGDVLAHAPAWKHRLPSRLTPTDALPAFPLPPLGGLPGADAEAAFADAIGKPLRRAPAADGWRFEGNSLDRLAAAFAAVRARPSDAPLVPELQVVLGRLVREARAAKHRALVVPDDVQTLIDTALRDHLIGALGRVVSVRADKTIARTMALLALRRLADEDGRAREAGLPRAALTGLADDAVLDALAGPEARLVIPDGEGDEATVRLSHDRLAEVLTTIDHVEVFGPSAGFEPRLIELAGRVGLRAAQYAQSGDGATLALGPRDLWRVARHRELLWDEARRAWWRGVKRRVATLAALALVVIIAGVFIYQQVREAERRTRIEEAVAQIEGSNSPEAILTGLQVLIDEDAPPATLDPLIDVAPLAAAEGTPDRAVEPARARFIRRRLGGESPATTAQQFGVLIAGVEAAWHPETPGRLGDADRRRLRAELREALRQRFPGELPTIDWQPVGGGQFMMGDHHDGQPPEQPVHRVTLPAFEIGRTEVTMGQYRAFDPAGVDEKNRSQPGMAAFVRSKGAAADRLPMWTIDWHEAWAFALWVDPEGRLPTEAEWEYAARGGPHAPEPPTRYWSGDDTDDLLAVGWTRENSGGLPREVCQPSDPDRRHPLELCDVHGNLREWVADCRSDSYPAGPAAAPRGPRRGALRVNRGGSFMSGAVNARSANRNGHPPGLRYPALGFRLARSAPSSSIEP